MHLITKKSLIASVADRFAATYQRRGQWPTDRDYSNEITIHTKLMALPTDSSEGAVTTIVGHNRLTRNTCHQCGTDSDVTVALGSEKHHMLDVKYVCAPCLNEAIRLVDRDTAQ